jgi:hypothetical protein
MRAFERIVRNRAPAEDRSPYAVRPFGTTPAELANALAAAEAAPGGDTVTGGGSGSNMTSSDFHLNREELDSKL